MLSLSFIYNGLMISVALHKWSILLLVDVGLSAPQYPMFYALPPPPPPPPPPPVAVPVGVPISIPIPIPVFIDISSTTSTTSTTTTEKPKDNNYSIWIPLPMPLSFPMGIPGPPPVIMIPFPPGRLYKLDPSSLSDDASQSSSSDSDDSSDSDSDSDSSSSDKKKKKKKKKRYGIYRRFYRRANDDSSEEELKPVLNFVSRNGDVKLRRRLSKQDAVLLMNNELSPQPVHRVHVMVGDDSKEKSRVKVVSAAVNSPNKNDQETKHVVMRRSGQQILNSNKELVFKPPGNKKISNISISFDVVR